MKYILLIIFIILYLCFNKKEGFSPIHKSNVRFDDNIIDDFYVDIYYDIYDINLNNLIAKNIIKIIKNNNTNILCIGSKSGHMLELLSKVNVTGLENNDSFINKSKKIYNHKVIKGNYNNINLFNNNFTHIVIPLFVIHLYKDLDYFFKIMYKWVKYNGYISITYLSNWDDYDVLLNDNPSFNANYNIEINEYVGGIILKEKITNKSGKIKRKNIWSYNNITLENLKYNSSLKDFKFIENVNIKGNINICTLQKN
jgi:hypothetical protein